MLIPGNSQYDKYGEDNKEQEQSDSQASQMNEALERFIQAYKRAYGK